MALLPRGVGARRVAVMVVLGGVSRPEDAVGDAVAGRREVEGSREPAPRRALKAAGLRTRGRVCGARGPSAGAHPQGLGLGPWAAACRATSGHRARGGAPSTAGGARPSEVGRTVAGREAASRGPPPPEASRSTATGPGPRAPATAAPLLTMGTGPEESWAAGDGRGSGTRVRGGGGARTRARWDLGPAVL